MSRYLQKCPNCAQMVGMNQDRCPYCGPVLEVELRPAISQLPVVSGSPVRRTESGQSRLAYQLAAGLLFLVVLIGVADMAFVYAAAGDVIYLRVFNLVVQFAFGVALLRFDTGIRSCVLILAVLGAILVPVAYFLAYDLVTAILGTLIQIGFGVSLVLLLTGESKPWRLWTAGTVFVAFVLLPNVGLLVMSIVILVMR